MTPVVPLPIHDAINEVEYLLEAIFMATGGISDRDQVNALQHVTMIAQGKLLEVEQMLEALDAAPEGGEA